MLTNISIALVILCVWTSTIHANKLRKSENKPNRKDEELNLGFTTRYNDLLIHSHNAARHHYEEAKMLYSIGKRNPDELLHILNDTDPFGESRSYLRLWYMAT
jgi:hypothetical protein